MHQILGLLKIYSVNAGLISRVHLFILLNIKKTYIFAYTTSVVNKLLSLEHEHFFMEMQGIKALQEISQFVKTVNFKFWLDWQELLEKPIWPLVIKQVGTDKVKHRSLLT